jgi:hypothetical protein
MEIHPPTHALNTWRDFFIHMATICLGLLIAIGLEQSVEALHRNHQHHQLLEGLSADSEKIHEDGLNADQTLTARLHWLSARAAQVQTALDQHHPIPSPAPFTSPKWELPADPTWTAARSSGLLSLFSEQDVKAFSELADLIANTEAAYNQYDLARRQRIVFEQSFRSTNDPNALANATPEDARKYLDLLRSETGALARLLSWLRQSLGANTAIQHGDRALDRIYAEEERLDVDD